MNIFSYREKLRVASINLNVDRSQMRQAGNSGSDNSFHSYYSVQAIRKRVNINFTGTGIQIQCAVRA